ncbi:RHS repeat domain-containing protein [Pseudomonas xantholysinigenes]|uniref:RHS repeat-associated core domain-containing protein n=1 Tax=Pseudomonas xantholysinigenes TaxID=2745490 RepID=A0A9E6PYW8_9PSED|nr:RHS repeat-associated core domain-containing protein [Pseudomonas xantholysinigenes]QXI39438.1 hypothetical protein HU772_004975 [Pseudomonas xantholysinigenes]
MINTPLHSQAGNFLDCLKTGVDNRTGQFTLALALPLPPANQLCGPTLTPTLSFSTLGSMLNNGFGLGWSLGLSQLYMDQDGTHLSLASGEQFAIDLDTSSFAIDSQLAFLDQKLKALRLTQLADGSLQVERKTGDSEILRQQGNSPHFLLEELRSPEGRRLFIDWLPFANGGFMLHQIRDEQRVLLDLALLDDELHLRLDPDSEQVATWQLRLSNERLTEIHLPGIPMPLRIDYDSIDLPTGQSLLLPSNVHSPLGGRDIIHWATDREGHHLPSDAPFPFLPRVALWSHASNGPESELHQAYQWIGTSNFLGFGSDQAFQWQSGQDNLYQVQSDYHYQVEITRSNAQGQTLETLTSTWNRFHLPTLETSRRGTCEVRTQTRYGLDPLLSWEQQAANCQLPHEVTTTWIDHAREGASRSERSTYQYDDFGNLLLATRPDGLSETCEYYAAAGEPGCPADPRGWVRHLKRKTLAPVSTQGAVTPQVVDYTYQALPSQLEGMPPLIVLASEQGGASCTEQAYVTEPGPRYGRIEQRRHTLDGLTTTTQFQYELDNGTLVTQITTVGFEQTPESRSSERFAQSLRTGLTTWEQDESGALTRYEYDGLGRITRTVLAADSAFERERTVRYHLHDTLASEVRTDQAQPLLIEQTDINGGRQRSWLDGAGRVVRVEREDLDHAPGVFREVARTAYDALGREISQTAQDWLPEQAEPLTLSKTTAYDDWGQPARTVTADDLTTHLRYDPIERRSEQWQTAGEFKGPTQVTQFNSAGSPIEQHYLDSDGMEVRSLILQRDGFDRVIEQRLLQPEMADIVTLQRHDEYSRVVEQQLADGTRLNWSFAAHSDGAHPESLSLSPAGSTDAQPLTLGRQTFDGLGRQLTVEVGGRTTHSHYRDGQLPPSGNTLADGTRLAFRYEPLLDNALLATEINDQPGEQLEYHPRLGTPSRASNAQDSLRWHLSPAGQTQLEAWEVDGQTYSSTWRHSLNGLVLGVTDAAGTEHVRPYDAQGRLSRLEAGSVETCFSYDAFSRPAVVTSHDNESGRQLIRQLDYDRMGREERCTFTVSGTGETQTYVQTMTYSGLDQVVARTWDDGEQTAEETFGYDPRGRLERYTANSTAAVKDAYGNLVVEQHFTFNAFDGYSQVLSTFADGSEDLSLYSYAADDPTQVLSISHSHASWPALIELSYDDCGRVIADSLGRRMHWDHQDRLTRVELDSRHCDYRYRPDGHLCDRVLDDVLERTFFSAGQATHIQQGDTRLEIAGEDGSLFALSTLAEGIRRTTLLGCDGQGSVRLEADDDTRSRRYGAHGQAQSDSVFGYTGERREALTGWHIPGGYRPYDPVLMMFLCPDDESPFGRGGINAYAYCGGDPVNRIDPDGHSWVNWALAGAGLALGTLATLASLGTTAPVLAAWFTGSLGAFTLNSALAVGSSLLGTVSLGTGVASLALDISGKHEQAASILGWISLGAGVASAVLGMLPTMANRLQHLTSYTANKRSSFKPFKVGPGGKERPASVLYGRQHNSQDVTFVPNLFQEGMPALVTHGSPLGKLMNAQGLADEAASVARNIIAPRLAQMGYPDGEKIVLVACWGGKSGAAQAIANELKRPVRAFSRKLAVKNLASLQSNRRITPTVQGSNTLLFKASPWRRLISEPQFTDNPRYRLARHTTYHPL